MTRPAVRKDVAAPPSDRVPDMRRSATGDRPLVIRMGRRLCGASDRLIGGSSLVSTDPVLDMRDFAWTCDLRNAWSAIREEACAVALHVDAAAGTATPESCQWRPFFLHGHGFPIAENLARCPHTATALSQIPDLKTAFFSALAPGAHIPAHRGVTKGLITCNLGLIVPRDGDARMRVHDRVLRWAEGQTLVFDDTYDHEAWNDSNGTCVVLLIQFERPLAQPGKWLADLFMGAVRRSPVVRAARTNIHAWNAAIRQMDV